MTQPLLVVHVALVLDVVNRTGTIMYFNSLSGSGNNTERLNLCVSWRKVLLDKEVDIITCQRLMFLEVRKEFGINR